MSGGAPEEPVAARSAPVAAGGALAVCAAVAFGVTTPLIALFGARLGSWTTAGLLYGGAAAVSLAGRRRSGPPLGRAELRRVAVVAVLGAVVAPVCLVWGLPRTGAAVASLLLNFEAVFTAILARVFFAEPIGGRAAVAVSAMVAGGAVLVAAGAGANGGTAALGAAAVLVASLAWALDNVATRPLADLDPTRVVLWKGSLGALLSLGAAALLREALPTAREALELLACGAIGYGVSLRLYLLAQRRIGAARTGSIFAIAPFVGAAVALAMGDRHVGWATGVAGALFAAGVYLHLTERHSHAHEHAAVEHSHAHRHDDAHHDHLHDVYPPGEHTHWHAHASRVHTHPHAPDTHHRHRH